MKTSIAALAAILGLIAGVVWMGPGSSASVALAEEHQLPGMCNGRTDPNVVLNAHANGSRPAGVPKYILNLSTDELGNPAGTLIVGQGKDRLFVGDWCRFWQHQPGSGSGGSGHCEEDEGHDPDNDMVNAHAVGLAWYKGEQVLVRTDVRDGEDGKVFRVRYRALDSHHEEVALAADDGCDDDGGCGDDGGDDGCGEDEGWTRIPAEGWHPLAQLKVRQSE